MNKDQLPSNDRFSAPNCKYLRRNLESFVLIWCCNTTLHSNRIDEDIFDKLRQVINFLLTIDNIEECIKYIENNNNEKIFLILSGEIAQVILSKMHHLQQIIVVYIYDIWQTNDMNWKENYSKVQSVINEPDELIRRISEDQVKYDRYEHTLPTTILSFPGSTKEQSHHKLDGYVLWSKLFMATLLKLTEQDVETSLEETFILLNEQYQENSVQCTKISEFKRTYRSTDAVMWYTKEPFLYQVINRALRIQDIDTVFAFRFLIRDIYDQLETEQIKYLMKLEEQSSSVPLEKVLHTYRGQKLSRDEFEVLKLSQGKYISINTFFSTSKNKQISLMFIQSFESNDSSQQVVLFDIESDITAPFVTQPFADINHLSQFSSEEEVLFMIGIVFKMTGVFYEDNVWIIKLVLCDERNDELNELFRVLKQEVVDLKTNLLSVGNILLDMGRLDKAEAFYQRYLKNLAAENTKDLAIVYDKLAIIKENSHWDGPKIEILHSLLNRYADRSKPVDFDRILNDLQAKNIRTDESDDLARTKTHENISNILRVQERFDESLNILNESLLIDLKVLPKSHPKLGKTYESIGDLHMLMKNYGHALESYQSARQIKSESLPDDHRELGQLYRKIGDIYAESLIDYQLALKYFHLSLNIFTKIFPGTHEVITELQDSIGTITAALMNQ
ncbi:unnamed protein product [Adineta ricciae]|uniref:NAD(P)(+)--arginine ADP-ribosyltransferase n=1 Tax=Adineta ricciae TaxID=249248 RepID=A0A815F8F5_ADIRI|nr:unnamed protein product [Adineta ricciae]CAF1544397.1 unnamed protein product [Adineta ricciae]